MKKILAAWFIGVLCASGVLPVYAQKTRTVRPGKTSLRQPAAVSFKQNVTLDYASAYTDGDGVYLEWQAAAENGNLGFFVSRLGAKGFEPASEAMIAGGNLRSSETPVVGGRYTFYDPQGGAQSVYAIECLSASGERQIVGQAAVAFVKDLRQVAGASAEELRAAASARSSIERDEAEMPSELAARIAAASLAPNPETQRWIAAQPGVKLAVKQDGVYRVTRAELQAAGFNVATAGNLWQLYTDGNEQAIVVGANDSYIEFYGRGLDTQETGTRVYYLVAGAQPGKRIATVNLPKQRGSLTAPHFRNVFSRKERALYVANNIINGEQENFFGNLPITTANSPTYNFTLPSIDYANGKTLLEVNVQTLVAGNQEVRVVLNGQQLGSVTGFGILRMTGYFKIPTTLLQAGNNTLQFQGVIGVALAESIKVNYPRKFEAAQNRLTFVSQNNYRTSVSGFTSSNVRVFDLSNPDEPTVVGNAAVTNANGSFTVGVPNTTSRPFYAVEDSAVLTVGSIQPIEPSTLSSTTRNGEMIIVTHRDWMTQANDWANYRRSQGLTVEVVELSDVYDEFSYGAQSSNGMRDFFQYAKNNWQTAPNYILLMGDATYDPKNYLNRPFQSYVPTKLVDTIYEETGSDEALCDFNDDGLAEIAIGRIPVRNGQTLTLVLNKVMAFESTVNTAFGRGALFASDLPNGYDFEALSQRVAGQLPNSVPKMFINRGQTDSRNLLLSTINTGKYLVNYSGHGSNAGWDGNFFVAGDAANLTNSPNYSMFIALTCLNGYFIRGDVDIDCLAEALLKAQNGAVAVWASSGKTTPDVQEILATRFYQQLGTSNMTRIGDLIKDAKSVVNGGRDVRLSWVLMGDPAMKVK